MASHTQSMTATDFLRFMDEPDSQVQILEEYNSIVLTQKELRHSPDQNDDLENKGCFPLVHYLHRSAKLSNNEATLNASFVDGYDVKRKFLFIRSPRAEDCNKFWQTVYDNKVQIIVMTCRLKDKSFQYWSPKEGCILVCNKLTIKTVEIKIQSHFILTLLNLTDQSGRGRKIFHFQYTAWPRAKFSHQPDAFIDFFHNVNGLYVHLKERVVNKKLAPVLVHCLDGVGSSDLFCLFDICVTQFEKTGMLLLPNVLKKMRQQKHGSINRSDHYVLCYHLVEAYIKDHLSIGPYM